MNTLTGWLGHWLARFLSRHSPRHDVLSTTSGTELLALMQPGDVLLVDGNTRISTAIKYLTQSSWSHAAMFVGTAPFAGTGHPDHCLVEADLNEGVRSLAIDEYTQVPTRICRAVGLSTLEQQALVKFVLKRMGERYDLRNVVDLARYLLPTPPVPVRFRRQMIALGSGEPTRAICSTLIAQAFQAVRYPILPRIVRRPAPQPGCDACYDEIFHIRHHSLFAPRDFDISPYFKVVKPALEGDFDYRGVRWNEESEDEAGQAA